MPRLWHNRHLVASLVRRQITVRYRQSFAGLIWAIVPPLATLATATLVFHKVARVDTGEVPYVVFTFAGLAPWTLLATSLTLGVPSILAGYQMVTRFSFPRAALPLSVIGTAAVDLTVAFSLFVVFAYALGSGLPLTAIWFPAILLIEIVFIIGIVLLGSALNVFSRDVKLALPLMIQLWLFLTPVMYPLSSVPSDVRPFFIANPMTGLIESFRNVLVYGQGPAMADLFPSILGAAGALAVGVWYFGATEARFADVI